jgi:hypothetical protein
MKTDSVAASKAEEFLLKKRFSLDDLIGYAGGVLLVCVGLGLVMAAMGIKEELC